MRFSITRWRASDSISFFSRRFGLAERVGRLVELFDRLRLVFGRRLGLAAPQAAAGAPHRLARSAHRPGRGCRLRTEPFDQLLEVFARALVAMLAHSSGRRGSFGSLFALLANGCVCANCCRSRAVSLISASCASRSFRNCSSLSSKSRSLVSNSRFSSSSLAMTSFSSAVALLRSRVDDQFGRFAHLFHDELFARAGDPHQQAGRIVRLRLAARVRRRGTSGLRARRMCGVRLVLIELDFLFGRDGPIGPRRRICGRRAIALFGRNRRRPVAERFRAARSAPEAPPPAPAIAARHKPHASTPARPLGRRPILDGFDSANLAMSAPERKRQGSPCDVRLIF